MSDRASDPWNPPLEPAPAAPEPMPLATLRDGEHQGVRWWVMQAPGGVPFVTLAAGDPYVFRVEDCAGWTVAERRQTIRDLCVPARLHRPHFPESSL